MKILKLYGHKNNPGGVVNFQNALQAVSGKSMHRFYHYRTGKVLSNAFLSNGFIRYLDQLWSYCYFPVFLYFLNPDVIEINSSLVSKAFKRDRIYLRIARFVKPSKKIILFNHGWSEEFKFFMTTHNKERLVAYFKTFDFTIILAKAFKGEIEALGIDPTSIQVMTTGVNTAEYGGLPTVERPSKIINILFLSRIEKAKGIAEFIAAIPAVVAKNENVRFIIAGTGSYLAAIKKSPIVQSFQKYIIFKGYVTGGDKIELFHNSDIFVLPSFYGEGCPVAVLEAMASGLPLIYTSVGALSEILTDGVNGLCIEIKSAQALAEAINFLIENPLVIKQIGAANRIYSAQFDLGHIQKQLESIYTTI